MICYWMQILFRGPVLVFCLAVELTFSEYAHACPDGKFWGLMVYELKERGAVFLGRAGATLSLKNTRIICSMGYEENTPPEYVKFVSDANKKLRLPAMASQEDIKVNCRMPDGTEVEGHASYTRYVTGAEDLSTSNITVIPQRDNEGSRFKLFVFCVEKKFLNKYDNQWRAATSR